MRVSEAFCFCVSPATVAVLIYQRIVSGLIIQVAVSECDNSKWIRHFAALTLVGGKRHKISKWNTTEIYFWFKANKKNKFFNKWTLGIDQFFRDPSKLFFHDTARKFEGKILTDYTDYVKKQLFQRQEAISYVTKIDLTNPSENGESK